MNSKKRAQDSFEKRSLKISDEQQTEVIDEMIIQIKTKESSKDNDSNQNK